MKYILVFFRTLAKLFGKKPPVVDKRIVGASGGAATSATATFVNVGDGAIRFIEHMRQEARFAWAVVNHMKGKGYEIDRNPDNGNIVYVSGFGLDFLPNMDERDGWNDLRLIIKFDLLDNVDTAPQPYIAFVQKASTSPGLLSSKSHAARALGGVANVVPGQYEAWEFGYHKKNLHHPALIQVRPIEIWRDKNGDGDPFGESCFWGKFGINQHSTKPGFDGARVGAWSAGCLVGQDFKKHLEFLEELKKWDVFKKDNNTKFVTTVIDGKELLNLSAQSHGN